MTALPQAPRSICVFCGARPGLNPAHTEAAQAVGRMLAVNGWRLVYGAGDVGLMGDVARAAQEAGAATMGVIPVHLMGLERGKRDVTQFVITEDMHERKKVMFMNSDAIVVLPGQDHGTRARTPSHQRAGREPAGVIVRESCTAGSRPRLVGECVGSDRGR